MEKAYDELIGIIKAFRQARALKYDKKYNREHNAAQKNAHFAELNDKIETTLGETGGRLLRDYTDSVIELYNTDADYFYNSGFNDCEQIYSKLFNIAPFCGTGDKDEDDCDDVWLDIKTDKLDGIKTREAAGTQAGDGHL